MKSRSEDTLILCVPDSIINRPPFKHPFSVPLRNAVAASRKCVVSAFAGLVRALISSIHPSSIDPGEMTRRALLARAQGTANIHEQTSLGYCEASSTEKPEDVSDVQPGLLFRVNNSLDLQMFHKLDCNVMTGASCSSS